MNSYEYFTIKESVWGEYKEAGSRFIGVIEPFITEHELKEKLHRIKEQYPGASHYCFAYRLGSMGSVWRSNDDGEPSGTAGKPILNQLMSAQLSDVIAWGIRYYGGKKLGTSGLIKAYKTCTDEALNRAVLLPTFTMSYLEIDWPYQAERQLERVLAKDGIKLIQRDYGENIYLKLGIRPDLLAHYSDLIVHNGGIIHKIESQK